MSKKRKPAGTLTLKMTLGELMQKVADGEIRLSPIRREALSPELEHAVRNVWHRCAKYMSFSSFEEFEIGFLRDQHPEQEVRVWQKIAAEFEAYIADNPEADKGEVVAKYVLESMAAGW